MAKATRRRFSDIPVPAQFEIIKGTVLVKAQSLARLAGVHPVAIEIANKLIREPRTGAQFNLSDKAMLDRAREIEDVLVRDLRKVIKGLGHVAKVKSVLDENRLIFWFDQPK